MISIRCKDCNKELLGHSTKTITCGCPNMATIRGDKISAVDLSHIVMLNSIQKEQKSNVLSSQDIMWQEARRQRKVRRLDFEVR
jgi:phage FluMu protein Com